MILSDRHQFAFVHIPKCAGTSVRKALRPIDETAGTFDRIGHHPGIGTINFAHLTLADLDQFFPEQYAKILAYHSVAIVRDPVDRFFSALFQRLREFKALAQSQITPAMIEDESKKLVVHLKSATGRLELEYVHFNRQSDYIFNDGVQIVQNVFALDHLDQASAYIEQRTGISLTPDAAENRSVALRAGALTPVILAFRKPYIAIVPKGARNRIHAGLTKMGVYDSVEKRQFLKSRGVVDRFLRDYYRRDFELYAHARAA